MAMFNSFLYVFVARHRGLVNPEQHLGLHGFPSDLLLSRKADLHGTRGELQGAHEPRGRHISQTKGR